MANWQMVIDFADIRHGYDKGVSIQDVAKQSAEALKKYVPEAKRINREMGKELENEIIPLFEQVAENDQTDIEDYDDALSELYDWADTALDNNWNGKKMAWVKP